MRARGLAPLLALASALPLASCGDDATTASSLANPNSRAPINGFEIDPRGGFLLSTNRGLFRIDDGSAKPIRSTAQTPAGPAAVGDFMNFTTSAGNSLLGSGHPNDPGKVANFLGLLRSADGGRTWRSISRYGFSDLHALRLAHGRLYASDAVLDGLLISQDGGSTWSERSGPPARVFDFVVDPEDPEHLIAAAGDRLYRSEDGGGSWRELAEPAGRLAWPAPDALYLATPEGRVSISDDGAASWSLVGLIDGEPWRLAAAGPQHVYAALADATIVETTDSGGSWEEVFTP